MAGENNEAVNPLDAGNDPNSVQSAADDFTAMLNDEGKPPRRERAAKPAKPSPEPQAAEDAGDTDDGKSERQPEGERPKPREAKPDKARDPILDGDEPEDKGDPEDDDPDDEPEDDAPDDKPDDDEDDEEETDFLKSEHEVKVNGETVKITGAEALAGYMKDADYRQGTERNAREYEEIEKYASEVVESRKRADSLASEALALMQALQPSQADWEAMKAQDPQGYIKAQEQWAGIVANAKKFHEGRTLLAADQQRQAITKDAKYFETQEKLLVKEIPALRDEKKAEAFRAEIIAYGKKAGYSVEELQAGATDHKDLITLYKAAQYDKIRASQSAAGRPKGPKESTEAKPRVPNSANTKNRSAQRAADDRLRRSGRQEDAADAFAQMVRSGG